MRMGEEWPDCLLPHCWDTVETLRSFPSGDTYLSVLLHGYGDWHIDQHIVGGSSASTTVIHQRSSVHRYILKIMPIRLDTKSTWLSLPMSPASACQAIQLGIVVRICFPLLFLFPLHARYFCFL